MLRSIDRLCAASAFALALSLAPFALGVSAEDSATQDEQEFEPDGTLKSTLQPEERAKPPVSTARSDRLDIKPQPSSDPETETH
jgi:hypothetical protein